MSVSFRIKFAVNSFYQSPRVLIFENIPSYAYTCSLVLIPLVHVLTYVYEDSRTHLESDNFSSTFRFCSSVNASRIMLNTIELYKIVFPFQMFWGRNVGSLLLINGLIHIILAYFTLQYFPCFMINGCHIFYLKQFSILFTHRLALYVLLVVLAGCWSRQKAM